MSKKVVIIEFDDFKAMKSLLLCAQIDLEKIENSFFKAEVRRRIKEVQAILDNSD